MSMTPFSEWHGKAHGVMAAVLTPMTDSLEIDHKGLEKHCRWLLANGCDGLAVLGTTSEANSFTVNERLALLEHLAQSGIPGEKFLPGVGCCAMADTAALARQALAMGAMGVLMLPPFYYKNLSEDGLFASFARTIDMVGDARLRVYLYHFPQMAGVPIPNGVIERLLKVYPGIVVGMKDSSGDFAHMEEVVRAFPGFAMLSGADHLLLPLLKSGGVGCITAVANVASALAAEVCAHFRTARGEAAHSMLSSVRALISGPSQVAALKEIMARHSGRASWRNIRPPLMPMTSEAGEALFRHIAETGYDLPPCV